MCLIVLSRLSQLERAREHYPDDAVLPGRLAFITSYLRAPLTLVLLLDKEEKVHSPMVGSGQVPLADRQINTDVAFENHCRILLEKVTLGDLQ